MHRRVALPSSAERRIRREARSATLRERALSLRQAGWTLASIGQVLGVSTTRAFQMVRKAERLIHERSSKQGAPGEGRPSSNSIGLLVADRSDEHLTWYPPTTT
jgi:hypothetical protein